MPYNAGALSYLDNLAAMTQQAALDNEAARQQLALEQQQSQARIAEAQQAMEDALAQQQAAYAAQQQQAQLQAQQQQAAASAAAMSTGNKWADEFIASADKFNYGTHSIDPNGATLWNRKVLDNWLDAKAKEENWNALQKDQIKKQVKDAVIKASSNKHLFDTEERGFWGAVGDIGNSLADSAIGGLADLASTLNVVTYEGAKRMGKAGYTDALGLISLPYVMEKVWEATGLGDGKMNWDKQIDDAVVAARSAWGDLKSDYSKDAARARAAARGVNVCVVFRSPRHVFGAQFQAQRVVNGLGVRERNIDKLFPQRQHGFIAALQLHNVFARGVGKGRVFVKAHFGGAVKLLQIRQLKRGIVFLLLNQISDQHAELRTPVADVVLADDGVAHKFQHARNAVADDAGTQMANVHFLRQIGRGIVDDDGLRFVGFCHAETRVVQSRMNILGEKFGEQAQVDKTGTGYFRAFNHGIVSQCFGDLLRQLARILFGFFRRPHYAVDLEIAEVGIFRRLQYDGAVGQTGSGKGCLGFTFDGLV